MSQLSSLAENAYGTSFVTESGEVAKRLGISQEWLLAAMAWETGYPPGFVSKGPPWPVNHSDNGFGLIGFTPGKDKQGKPLPPQTMPQFPHTPLEQLADVEVHYRRWMSRLGISAFGSPEDLYLIVRGPYGIGQPDSFDMGGGLNKGQVLLIYRNYLKKVGL
jgi:hypothetical protein